MRWGAVLLTMLSTATVAAGCNSSDPPAAKAATSTTQPPAPDAACDDIDVKFSHANTSGVLASGFGWSYDGARLLTTDGGGRWRDHELPDLIALYAIEFVDPLHGWMAARAVVEEGETPGLLRTIDGGETWAYVASTGGPGLHGGAFMTIDMDGSSGIVVTGDPVGEGGAVTTTEDSGATWQTLPEAVQVLGSKVDLAFGTAWLSSVPPGRDQTPRFFSSHDGHAWTAHELVAPRETKGFPIESYDVPRFTDARHGSIAAIAAGECDEHPNLVVAITEDGGISWAALSSTELALPDGGFDTADVAVVRGADVWWVSVTRPSEEPATIPAKTVVMQSTDHGLTWTAPPSLPKDAAIVASDGARRVWARVDGPDPMAVDGTLFETRDSGATWTDITPPS